MITYYTLNFRLSQKANENLYLSEFNSKENDRFIDSSMFVDMFDESNTKCVASVGHNRFSEYIYMLKHNEYIQSKAFTIQENNKSTTKTILFYVIFEKLPNQVTFDNEYEYGLSESTIKSIVDEIEKVASLYKNANIKVVSNVFKHYTSKANIDDLLFKRIVELNNEKVSVDVAYNTSTIDPSEVEFVVTNKTSFLFTLCVDKKVPIVLSNFDNVSDESYIIRYFNNMESSSLFIFSDTNEFNSFLCNPKCDDMNYSCCCEMYDKVMANYIYLTNLFNTDDANEANISKLYLHAKANVFKQYFDTDANKNYVTLTHDIEDTSALLTTVLHHKFESQVKSENARWLGLDSDNFVHKDSDKVSLRYYYKSYNNIKSIYSFSSVEDIEYKFSLGTVQNMKVNESGAIWVFLDNPFGRNYTDEKEWVVKWKETLTKLVNLNLKNRIHLRPYAGGDSEQIDAVYNDHFKDYKSYVVYDSESRNKDILDVLNNDNVYFCVKRQGPYFGKCFTRGKLMLSALTENESKTKTDRALLEQYEYKLGTLTSTNVKSKLQDMGQYYLNNKFEVLKIITSYLVTIEDVINGKFLKALLNK